MRTEPAPVARGGRVFVHGSVRRTSRASSASSGYDRPKAISVIGRPRSPGMSLKTRFDPAVNSRTRSAESRKHRWAISVGVEQVLHVVVEPGTGHPASVAARR